MRWDGPGKLVSRRPAWIVVIWLGLAAGVGIFSPNLTKLAAEGQANMLPSDAESLRAAALVKESWPDQAFDAMAVAVLYRAEGLTEADRQFALRLARKFEEAGRPKEMVHVLGPGSEPEESRRGWRARTKRSRWSRPRFHRRSSRRCRRMLSPGWNARRIVATSACPLGLQSAGRATRLSAAITWPTYKRRLTAPPWRRSSCS